MTVLDPVLSSCLRRHVRLRVLLRVYGADGRQVSETVPTRKSSSLSTR